MTQSRSRSALKVGQLALNFALSTAVLTVLSLVLMPVMIKTSGVETWSHIALGQGLGSFLMVLVGWAWWIGGPARVARMNGEGRAQEYAVSAWARSALFAVVAAPLIVVAVSAPRNSAAQAITVGMLFTASTGLTSAWFFAGLSRPLVFFLCETLPRAVAAGAALVLMIAGRVDAVGGVAIQTVGMLGGFVVVSFWVSKTATLGGARSSYRIGARVVAARTWRMRAGLYVSLLTAAYQALPITVVAAFVPAVLSGFAVYDKLLKQFVVGLQPLISAAQGGLATAVRSARGLARALAAFLSLALVGWVLTAAITPWVVHLLAAGEVLVTWPAAVGFGACVALGFAENVLTKAFIPLVDGINVAASVGAIRLVAGTLATLIGGAVAGVEGAVWGLAAGYLVSSVVLSVVVHRGRERVGAL